MLVPSGPLADLGSLADKHPYLVLALSWFTGRYLTAARLEAKFREAASVFDAFCMMLVRFRASYRRLTAKKPGAQRRRHLGLRRIPGTKLTRSLSRLADSRGTQGK